MWRGDCTLKKAFPDFIALVGQGILQWQMLCVGLVGEFIGIFNFVVHRRIGRKSLLIGLWPLFTLGKCEGLALIRFVGSQQGAEVLRLEVTIFLCTPQLSLSLGGWCGHQGPSKGGFLFKVSLFR